MMKKADKKQQRNTSPENVHKDGAESVHECGQAAPGEDAALETVKEPETPEQPIEKEPDEPRGPKSEYVLKLEERLVVLNDKFVRLMAEYDNYRKRTSREMDAVANIASERLIQQFLPILDNLDRATEHRNDKTTFEDYVQGIALIEDQLRKVLAQTGLRKMEVIGEMFDPAAHSAVLQADSKEHEPGVVIAEVEKGYTLNEKIIRHPKVVVSK